MNKIIDAHVHLGIRNLNINQSSNLILKMENKTDSLINLMNEYNIEKSVIFPFPHRNNDIDNSNEYIYNAWQQHYNRLIPFCRINQNLEENLKKGFMGAKLHLVYEDFNVDEMIYNFRLLEYYDKTLIIHALYKNKVKQVKTILNHAPDLKIILAHMGREKLYTFKGIVETLKGLKNYQNVFFETSTVGHRKAIEEAYKIVSDERIIFGSDYPFGKYWFQNQKEKYSYSNDLSIITEARIPEKSKQKILYSNINNLIK